MSGDGFALPGGDDAVPASGDCLFGCGRGDDALPGFGNALPSRGDEVPGFRDEVSSEADFVSGVRHTVSRSGYPVPGDIDQVPAI